MHAAGLHRVVRDVVDVEAFLAQEAAEPVAVPVLRGLLKHVPAPPPGFDQPSSVVFPHALHRLDQLWRRGVHPHAFGGKDQVVLANGPGVQRDRQIGGGGAVGPGVRVEHHGAVGVGHRTIGDAGQQLSLRVAALATPRQGQVVHEPFLVQEESPANFVGGGPHHPKQKNVLASEFHGTSFDLGPRKKNGMILKNFLIANIFFTGRPYLECRVPCRDCTLDCHRLCFCNNRDR